MGVRRIEWSVFELRGKPLDSGAEHRLDGGRGLVQFAQLGFGSIVLICVSLVGDAPAAIL